MNFRVSAPPDQPQLLYDAVRSAALLGNERVAHDFVTCMKEAIGNCIRHGAGVEIEIIIQVDSWHILGIVKDRESSFIPPPFPTREQARDRMLDLPLTAPGGRGILLMVLLSERVVMRNDGDFAVIMFWSAKGEST